MAVAEDIVRGASLLAAAAKYGISRSRLMRWLDWGRDADARGAGPEDIHAPYLNFFLKTLQAQGHAVVRLQVAAATYHPQWWLENHPESRAELGRDSSGQLLLGAPATSASEATVVEADPSLTVEDMRSVLRTLIDAGAALSTGDPVTEDSVAPTSVEGDFRDEPGMADGTEEQAG